MIKPTIPPIPKIVAIAKDTATIYVRQRGKFVPKVVERSFRLNLKKIEIGLSQPAQGERQGSAMIVGEAWTDEWTERYLSGQQVTHKSKLKRVWLRPREWCWCVGNLPDVTVEWSLVSFGYQLDIFNEGEHVGCSCRDLGGSHKISAMQTWLIKDAEAAADRLRKRFP